MAKPEPFYIDVDLKKNTQYEVPSVTQMDTATFFIVRITDDGRSVPGLLDYFSTITMTSERPDRKSFYILGKPVEGKENEILFHLGTDETVLTGNVQAALQFYSVDGRNTSALFRYTVKKDLSGEYVPSERESSLIETVLIRGPEIMAAAEKATADAIKAMNDLTGAVSGALETLQTDKAAAILEMSTATDRANTAAAGVEGKINDTEAVRASTEEVRDATQAVQDATEEVRVNTESVRASTQTLKDSLDVLIPETEGARNRANLSADKADASGQYAQLQGATMEERVEAANVMLDEVNSVLLPDLANVLIDQIDMQSQLDNLIVEGDSSVEAAQARVAKDGQNYGTLKARLDTENEKVTAQLADKASLEALEAIASGSPKGGYATVSELQTALPTGASGIYVVAADGNWYYWNETAWTAGGIYQATDWVGAVTFQNQAWGLS